MESGGKRGADKADWHLDSQGRNISKSYFYWWYVSSIILSSYSFPLSRFQTSFTIIFIDFAVTTMMLQQAICLATALLSTSASAENVLGVYIFSRHGDRTAKSPGSTHLTNLGYQQVFESGTYYRNRYIVPNASQRIADISIDVVKLSQLSVSAPLDTVLMPAATGFLQGLYPPVGSTIGAQRLHNGSSVNAPLNGYQIIPVAQSTAGIGSEDQAWLQGASNCQNAIISSNSYFYSDDYNKLLKSTQDFYTSLTPMVNMTFRKSETSFKNAYTSKLQAGSCYLNYC